MTLSRFDALVGPSYTYPSTPVDCQECINFECLKIGSAGSPYQNMLVSTAGSKKIRFRMRNGENILDEIPTVNASRSRIRGLHKCSSPFFGDDFDGAIVVGADAVWKLWPPDKDMVCQIQRLGVITEGADPVSIMDAGGETMNDSDSPQRIVIADGTTLYVVNMKTGALTSLGNSLPLRPSSLAFLDSRVYMSGTFPNDGTKSQRVYWSELNHPEQYDELNFFSAQLKSDPVQALATAGNYLWAIGSETFEIWQTNSSASQPIRRVNGVSSGVGTCSGLSVASVASSVFFVGGGESGRLHIYQGEANGSINVISTDAMSQEFARYATMDDAVGFCWADDGQAYYAVTFPSMDVTWVYNISQKAWHKRRSAIGSVQHRWKIDATSTMFGRVFGASMSTGELFHVSKQYNDDDGVEITRVRIAPHLRSNGKMLNHVSLELDLECGNALPYGQGSDPQIMLRALDGAGRIAREPRWKSSGTQGMYRRRVKWNRLGCAVDRCYEIQVSDPIRWTIYGATIETLEGGG